VESFRQIFESRLTIAMRRLEDQSHNVPIMAHCNTIACHFETVCTANFNLETL